MDYTLPMHRSRAIGYSPCDISGGLMGYLDRNLYIIHSIPRGTRPYFVGPETRAPGVLDHLGCWGCPGSLPPTSVQYVRSRSRGPLSRLRHHQGILIVETSLRQHTIEDLGSDLVTLKPIETLMDSHVNVSSTPC